MHALQEAVHPDLGVVTQCFGQLPAIVALKWRQQSMRLRPCSLTRLVPAKTPAVHSIRCFNATHHVRRHFACNVDASNATVLSGTSMSPLLHVVPV